MPSGEEPRKKCYLTIPLSSIFTLGCRFYILQNRQQRKPQTYTVSMKYILSVWHWSAGNGEHKVWHLAKSTSKLQRPSASSSRPVFLLQSRQISLQQQKQRASNFISTLWINPHPPLGFSTWTNSKRFQKCGVFFSWDSMEEFRDDLLTAQDQKENSLLAWS